MTSARMKKLLQRKSLGSSRVRVLPPPGGLCCAQVMSANLICCLFRNNRKIGTKKTFRDPEESPISKKGAKKGATDVAKYLCLHRAAVGDSNLLCVFGNRKTATRKTATRKTVQEPATEILYTFPCIHSVVSDQLLGFYRVVKEGPRGKETRYTVGTNVNMDACTTLQAGNLVFFTLDTLSVTLTLTYICPLQVAVVHNFPGYLAEIWPGRIEKHADMQGKFTVNLYHKNDNDSFYNKQQTDTVKVRS